MAMTEDRETAREMANLNEPLGRFVIDTMMAAGIRLADVHLNPGKPPVSDGQMARVEQCYVNVAAAMKLHQDGLPARRIWQACVDLAAAAALLATEGDSKFAYDPKEVNRG
jgi:hypothetical protein